MYLLTADEMRRMDEMTIENFGLPGRVLMENAGRGAARVILENFPDIYAGDVTVVAGRGNNGGDGFVIARYLAQAGVNVTVYLLAERQRVRGDALANLELLSALDVEVVEVPDENTFVRHKTNMGKNRLWVDAILGTGLTDTVKGRFQTVIGYINSHPAPVFAVDIPSGLGSETGTPCGISIKADITATFGFAKTGHILMPGALYTGRLHIIDIGIPPFVVEHIAPRQHLSRLGEIRASLRVRPAQSHKGDTGHLLVAAGSCGKTGAAVMTAMSAMRCGAGLVTAAIPESINTAVESQACEAMTHTMEDSGSGILTNAVLNELLALLGDKRCLALGPGIGVDPKTKKLVENLVRKSTVPVVLDADGLNCIADNAAKILKNKTADVVLTPHPGEMARLAGLSTEAVQKDRIGCARVFAETHGVYVVLKGARTVIAMPDGRVHVNPTGNPGMASGGMGDVLTGMIAGFITQNYNIRAALRIAVYLHGAAADTLQQNRAGYGYLATDVMSVIPETIQSIMDGSFVNLSAAYTPVL
ncbi:MAG: NAD(P)H-hydrate dehydratase [Desulfosalsimonadaceae bacterium]